MKRFFIQRTILTLAVSVFALCQETMQTYRGHYTNVDYGFSVDIPYGLVGEGNPIHAPNHGFKIRVHPNSVVWIDVRADEVEALMAAMREPKVAHTLTDEDYNGDDD